MTLKMKESMFNQCAPFLKDMFHALNFDSWILTIHLNHFFFNERIDSTLTLSANVISIFLK